MAATAKLTADGKVELVEEGKSPVTLTADEVLQARTAAGADLNARQVTVKVAGIERTVTVAEALKSLEKVEGADAKFAEAADGRRVMEVMSKLQSAPKDVTADEFDFLLQKAGTPAPQRADAVKAFEALKAGQPAAGGDGGGQPLQAIPMEMLPQPVQAAAAHAQVESDRAFVQQVENQMKETLTKDPVLGTIITADLNGKPIDWQKSESVAGTLFSDAMDQVRSRVVLDGPRFRVTPDLLGGIAQVIRHRVLQISKMTQSAGQAGSTALGPALGLQPALQTNAPVERVPVTDPGHGKNFTQRLMAAFQAEVARR